MNRLYIHAAWDNYTICSINSTPTTVDDIEDIIEMIREDLLKALNPKKGKIE